MNNDQNDYPRYYEYDDVPVIAEWDESGRVTYKNWNGIESEAAAKAQIYGTETSKEAFDKVSAAYKSHFIEKNITELELNSVISRYYGTQFLQ